MEKHIMGENGISYTLGEDRSVLSKSVPSRGDRVSDWKVWNVEKVIFAGASKGIIFGAGDCGEVK